MTISIEVHVHFASVDDLKSIRAGLANLLTVGEKTMSAISEFAQKQKAFNDRISAGITGIGEDITGLNAKIAELQNSPGQITEEDQVTLNELQQAGEAVAQKVEALDGLTPPQVPQG